MTIAYVPADVGAVPVDAFPPLALTFSADRAQGFILNEDQALKLKLENYGNTFFVVNYADFKEIPITVYYRSPDPEVRQRTFPHITIDLIDVRPDYERMHRSAGYQPQPPGVDIPPGPYPPNTSLWEDQFPMPWMLIYQLSCLSRDPTHDRQLSQLMYRMFPFAFGSLDMSFIDGTVRRADFMNATRRDLPADATNKRIFRQIFTIGISSEYLMSEVQQIPLATDIDLVVEETISGTEDTIDIAGSE